MIRKPSKWASLSSPLPDRLTGLIPLPENKEHKSAQEVCVTACSCLAAWLSLGLSRLALGGWRGLLRDRQPKVPNSSPRMSQLRGLQQRPTEDQHATTEQAVYRSSCIRG